MRPHHICRCVQPQTPRQSINPSIKSNQTSRSKQAKNPWPKISLTGGGEDDRGAGAGGAALLLRLLLGRPADAIVVAGDVDEEEVDQVRDGEEAHGLPLLDGWYV